MGKLSQPQKKLRLADCIKDEIAIRRRDGTTLHNYGTTLCDQCAIEVHPVGLRTEVEEKLISFLHTDVATLAHCIPALAPILDQCRLYLGYRKTQIEERTTGMQP